MVYKLSDKVESFFCRWRVCRLPLNAGNEVFSAAGCLWSSLWWSAFCYLWAGSQWVMFIMCYCPSLAEALTALKRVNIQIQWMEVPSGSDGEGAGSSMLVYARPVGSALSQAPAVRQFLGWTRASHPSFVPSIPNKASLSTLEPLPRSIHHVESWSCCIMGPAACPLPCDLPATQCLSSSIGVPTAGKQNARPLVNVFFLLVCIYSRAFAYMHIYSYAHVCIHSYAHVCIQKE